MYYTRDSGTLTATLGFARSFPTHAYIHTHVVLKEVRVVPFDAVIQDGHHHVFTRVAPLPGPHDVHVGLAVMDVVVAVLRKETRTVRSERREGDDDNDEDEIWDA